MLNAPQSKAWWFLGGDAVHKATERIDREGDDSPHAAQAAWDEAWAEALQALDGVDPADVKAGGRATKEWPARENRAWWEHHGPIMVQGWMNWIDARLRDGWIFYPLPDGSPAIEVPIQVEFDDVLVKGYIDRVMVNDDGEVLVVDLKTGSRQPDATLQLGVYAQGMHRNFGIQPTLGAYYMARKGELSTPASLLHYTHELLGQWFSSAKRGIEAEVFIPHVTGLCNTCSVAPYCKAVGGSDEGLASLKS